MATEQYVEDVFNLINVLKPAALQLGDTQVDNSLGEEQDRFFVNLHVHSDDLRAAIAVQQAVQLTVDAVAVIAELYDFEADDFTVYQEQVAELLIEPLVDISIRRLSDGSFVTDLRVRFRRRSARAKFLAIATLVGVGVGIILFPPTTIPLLTFTVVMSGMAVATLVNELRQDAPPRLHLQTIEADAAIDATATTEIVVSDSQYDIVTQDVFLSGSDSANAAFIELVKSVPVVRPDTRLIQGAEPGYQKARIWSSIPVSPNVLRQLAEQAGTTVVAFV